MCLLILELVMLVGGLYTLVTGKVPDALIGKKRTEGYEVSTGMARLIGLVLAIPLPCAFLSGVVLALMLDPDTATIAASVTEIALVLGGAILATVIYMSARKPVEAVPGFSEGGSDNPMS